jgi:hypothetical protein
LRHIAPSVVRIAGAEAEKPRQPVTPTLGEEAAKILDEVYASPAEIIDAARAVASE